MKPALTIGLNILLPGTGLIVLRREWLGLSVSLLFGIAMQLGIWGTWIAPLSLPGAMTISSWGAVAVIWIAAQWLFWDRWRLIFASGIEEELERLLQRSDEALAKGDLKTVRQVLMIARTIDDEHIGVNMRWAALMSKLGHARDARSAWQRVLLLEPNAEQHKEAMEALSGMSGK